MKISLFRRTISFGMRIMVVLIFAGNLSMGHSQENLESPWTYGIHKVIKPFAQTRACLLKAQTVTDLNKHFQRSWVDQYHALEVIASCHTVLEKDVGQNDTLTSEQLDLLSRADTDKDIRIVVHYIPENDMKHNDIKSFDFFISIDPDISAQFPGGSSALKQYLDESALAVVSTGSVKEHQLAAIKFIIDESGQIIEPLISSSSGNESIDQVMIDVVCGMPAWTPARYANGQTVPQEYVLTLGDMRSCVVNLLNIRTP